VATRLYLPEHWAAAAERRTKAKVPEDVDFRTKPEIALELLDRAKSWGVRFACVTADADYGDNPNFLAGLEQRRRRYVVAVRCDFAVTTSRRGGEVRRVDALVRAQAARSWRSVTWREGSRGWMRGRFVTLRGWRVTSSGPRRAGWLIGEDASDGKRRYYWSNFGPEVALGRLVEDAHRRHWVEQYHEEAKGLLGWDQYQGGCGGASTAMR
jgi:DDE superfamily endonuclease